MKNFTFYLVLIILHIPFYQIDSMGIYHPAKKINGHDKRPELVTFVSSEKNRTTIEKSLLVKHSDYFKNMFGHNLSESHHNKIVCPNTSGKAIDGILKLITFLEDPPTFQRKFDEQITPSKELGEVIIEMMRKSHEWQLAPITKSLAQCVADNLEKENWDTLTYLPEELQLIILLKTSPATSNLAFLLSSCAKLKKMRKQTGYKNLLRSLLDYVQTNIVEILAIPVPCLLLTNTENSFWKSIRGVIEKSVRSIFPVVIRKLNIEQQMDDIVACYYNAEGQLEYCSKSRTFRWPFEDTKKNYTEPGPTILELVEPESLDRALERSIVGIVGTPPMYVTESASQNYYMLTDYATEHRQKLPVESAACVSCMIIAPEENLFAYASLKPNNTITTGSLIGSRVTVHDTKLQQDQCNEVFPEEIQKMILKDNLIFAAGRKKLYCFDNQKYRIKYAQEHHCLPFQALLAHPTQHQIIVGCGNNFISIQKTATGANQIIFKFPFDTLTSLSINPSGSRLVGGSSDGTIAVWHIAKASLEKTATAHRESVRHIAFASDHTFFTAGNDGTIAQWSYANKFTAQQLILLRALEKIRNDSNPLNYQKNKAAIQTLLGRDILEQHFPWGQHEYLFDTLTKIYKDVQMKLNAQ